MGDIAKEFNMVDFIGMLIPGFLVTMLFSYEFGGWMALDLCFGTDVGALTKIIILTISGYVVGMLFHEVGDILEKMLWKNYIINPRTYAAHTTKLIDRYGAIFNDKLPSPKDNSTFMRILFCILSLCATAPFALVCCSAFQSLPCVWIFFCIVFGVVAIINSLIYLGLEPDVLASIVQREKNMEPTCTNANTASADPTEEKPTEIGAAIDATAPTKSKNPIPAIISICNNDAMLMNMAALMAGSNENVRKETIRKRNLFDGFRTMSRNGFLVGAFLRVYAGQTTGHLSVMLSKIDGNFVYSAIVHIALIILLARYWHYSYLKYKYCYEDVLNTHVSN